MAIDRLPCVAVVAMLLPGLACAASLAHDPSQFGATTPSHHTAPDVEWQPPQRDAQGNKVYSPASAIHLLGSELARAESDEDPKLLRELSGLSHGDGSGSTSDLSDLGNMRARAMKEAALRIGTQAALHSRYKFILSVVRRYADHLDTIFNFAPIMLDKVVLPPVIQRVTHADRLYDDQTMRSVQVGYRYVHPARIVTQAPTWRSFLVRMYPMPERPADVLLPKNSSEQKLWARYVHRGWTTGEKQANRNFKVSLNLMVSTYRGMLIYTRLADRGVVSAPNLATTGMQITSDGKTLNVGDRIYRLTRNSRFADTKQWRVAATPPHADSNE